ncbi:MAG: oxidoreductase [Gammaproteobacteria bacterium]|nr:oxidoreductase [Gammaproteobacteria bacterium]
MAKKWNLIVDVSRCNNCRLCFLAVKDEYIGNDFPGYTAAQPAQGHNWMEITRYERGSKPMIEAHFVPTMCNHCDDAPCLEAARDGAVFKRDDGIVIIDPVKSRGQKQIVDACPYGAVSWNEEKQIPQTWIFDAHLLDAGWTQTRLQQSCPTGVYRAIKVEDEEMQRIVAEEGLEVLHPEYGTRPRVYYKNLHLVNKCFVGGAVVKVVDGVEDCVENAIVILSKDGRELVRATSDCFGEWKIDGLDPDSGSYRVEITGDAGRYATEVVIGKESRYLGVLKLEAA